MTTPTDAELDALVAKAADGLCTRSALSRSDAGVIDLAATVALLSGLADAITALRRVHMRTDVERNLSQIQHLLVRSGGLRRHI